MGVVKKKFYSKEFNILISLEENGTISGEIIKAQNGFNNFRQAFSGIFSQNELQVSFAFFTELPGISTCFSGVIFHYSPNDECLWLRCWPVCELSPESSIVSECKNIILFDCPWKVQIIKTHKVIDFLTNIA